MDDLEPVKKSVTAQGELHAYKSDGTYVGVMIATTDQLADMGYQAGDAPSLDLEVLKAAAINQAHAIAVEARLQIANVDPKRAIGWVMKAMFGGIWQANEQSPNARLQPLADVAAQGFGIEVEMTGEDPVALRDRAIEKSGAYFLALQLVEGMERIAEIQINAADTPEALAQAIAQLRVLEEQALEKLNQLQSA
ncbi:hypothetical protein [Ascidiaceihabitans sp.]|uniref:hypothetical protein n=1 Tax=Ascidiaceihabitans sp. TaxID=1872644 RepID=UPI003297FE6F